MLERSLGEVRDEGGRGRRGEKVTIKKGERGKDSDMGKGGEGEGWKSVKRKRKKGEERKGREEEGKRGGVRKL